MPAPLNTVRRMVDMARERGLVEIADRLAISLKDANEETDVTEIRSNEIGDRGKLRGQRRGFNNAKGRGREDSVHNADKRQRYCIEFDDPSDPKCRRKIPFQTPES